LGLTDQGGALVCKYGLSPSPCFFRNVRLVSFELHKDKQGTPSQIQQSPIFVLMRYRKYLNLKGVFQRLLTITSVNLPRVN